LKLLHIITTLDVGGAEMHLLAQVRGQCARGHEVRVAYLKGGGRLCEDFRAAGASWVAAVGASPATPWRLREHFAWADLVHSHLLKADMLAALCALLFGKRKGLIASKHNDEQVLKRSLVGHVHGCLGAVARRTIVLSDHVGRFVQEYGRLKPECITRIYYGLDPAPFEQATNMPPAELDELRLSFGFGSQDVVFICVARFAPQKAHEVLIRAFGDARAAAGGERLRLLLVGDDPFGDGRQRAEVVASELGLIESGDVVFAGIRRDVPALLAASQCFVMSSLWEGLGLVFLEAMATRLPVLASDVSAVPEVVTPGQTGLLVPPADVAALTAGFVRLAGDADLRRRFGEAAARSVRERFALDRMVDETLAVYREVLAAG
jgi:glycosyltransferase involved in cell wall biosynthesis